MDAGCYAVHMAHTFGGATPEVVSAQAKLRDPAVDRAMTAELKFPGGHTGGIRCSMRSSDLLNVSARVVGDRGEFACSIRLCPNSSTDCRPSHAYQLDAFAAAVLRGQAVKTTPKDAVENMSAIHAIYRAAGLPSRNPS